MIRKLLSVVGGKCMADSADSPMNQEVLLGGHLFLIVLKVQMKPILKIQLY
jgi:DNA-directed RNA polymerase I subunit RPA2